MVVDVMVGVVLVVGRAEEEAARRGHDCSPHRLWGYQSVSQGRPTSIQS